MTDAARELNAAWERLAEAERADYWQKFLRDMIRGGLPSFSGPIGGGGPSSNEKPLPMLDELDRAYLRWRAEREWAVFFTQRFRKFEPIARARLGPDGNDERGKNLAQVCRSASNRAVRHLEVMVVIIGTVRPLDLGEAQKLAEEAVSPTARTCANVSCSDVVERLLGERCRPCYDYLQRTGEERPERLIARDMERRATA